MKKINLKIQLTVFLLFIALFSVLLLVLPKKDFSEQKTGICTKTCFHLSSLCTGSFTADFESYITEKAPFQDRWIDLKSRTERLLQKTENNGVYFWEDGALISIFEERI
jgi:hypothetical protein